MGSRLRGFRSEQPVFLGRVLRGIFDSEWASADVARFVVSVVAGRVREIPAKLWLSNGNCLIFGFGF